MLASSADARAKANDGNTPLHEAATMSLDVADLLPNPTKRDKIKLLLAQGAGVNAKDYRKTTLYHLTFAYAIEKAKPSSC